MPIKQTAAYIFLCMFLVGCGQRLDHKDNRTPVLSGIPGQVIPPQGTFAPIDLDLYVEDESPDSVISWTIAAPGEFNVTILNGIAQIAIANSQWRGTGTLTFTATDPEGLSAARPAVFGVMDPNDGEIVDSDGRLRIVWQTPLPCDSRVSYWTIPTTNRLVASTREEYSENHQVRLLELESGQRYDYFAFGLDADGDTIFISPPDSFITGLILPTPLLKAHFIDVKQGDGCLVQTASGFNLMVDGGYGTNSSPSPPPWDGDGVPLALYYLQSQSVQQIDLMVKTHDHADHYGGLQDILNSNVNVVETQAPIPGWGFQAGWFSGYSRQLDAYTQLKVLNCGYPPGVPTSNENNSSIVLKLTFGQTSLLLTGDAENGVNSYMTQNFNSDFPASILKVNHHGSSDATTNSWIAAVSPTAAVISCGAGNPYGHPTSNTLQALETYHTEIFRTDLRGTITMTCDTAKGWVWGYSLNAPPP